MSRKGRKMIFKTAEEIELIRENCLLVCKTLAYVGSMLKPGMTGEEALRHGSPLSGIDLSQDLRKKLGLFLKSLMISKN